jgi:hypothetical protein
VLCVYHFTTAADSKAALFLCTKSPEDDKKNVLFLLCKKRPPLLFLKKKQHFVQRKYLRIFIVFASGIFKARHKTYQVISLAISEC